MPAARRLSAHAICAVLLGAICFSTSAQTQKALPGLWEHTSTMKMAAANAQRDQAMAQVQQQMAALPPDQRKMMEDMMAKQGVGIGAKPNSVRVCISPEQAARGDLPSDDGRCKREFLERKANTLRFRYSCEGPPASVGEGSYTFVSDKAYTSSITMTSSGKDSVGSMEMTGSGLWLSADCGAIKPMR